MHRSHSINHAVPITRLAPLLLTVRPPLPSRASRIRCAERRKPALYAQRNELLAYECPAEHCSAKELSKATARQCRYIAANEQQIEMLLAQCKKRNVRTLIGPRPLLRIAFFANDDVG